MVPVAGPARPALDQPVNDTAGDADGLQWLHVDDAVIGVVKPSGLLSVPGRGAERQDCVAARVVARFPDALVVHRLDMATSGLMLMARGSAAQRLLSVAFAQRRVTKRYVACVDGRVAADTGEIDLPLSADWPNRPRQKVDPLHGKPSLTRYRVLHREAGDQSTRLELSPVSGRAHQLRVHLLAMGHPILGDALYAPPAVQARAPRLMLHAQSLSFEHPTRGGNVQWHSEAPF